jgi:hypothetical protein
VPTDDPRLERALHDAAPAVEPTDVVAQVAHRRARRRRNRRLTTSALAFVAILAVGTVAVLATGGDDSTPHVAAPAARLHARVVAGDGAATGDAGTDVTPKRVTLDTDAHLLSAPVLAGAQALSVASYDDAGPDGVALSHVVRIEGSHVIDIVDLKAHILSIAEGEGARWVLTQNLRPTGGTVPDAFLKRVTGTDVQSVALPLDADPVGPIAAVGGAVWVPVRDGVLQYDTAGTFVRKVSLAAADHRWVAQVGKFAAATDGRTVRSLQVTGGSSSSTTYDTPVIGLAAVDFDSSVLLAADDGGLGHARVERTTIPQTSAAATTLPDGFVATGLTASASRLWATGTVDGSPAIVLLDDGRVRATVVLEGASPGAVLAWTDARTVRAVTGGKLYEITLP